MADVTTKVCDVCGTSHNVIRWEIELTAYLPDGLPFPPDNDNTQTKSVDLCRRHRKRLAHFIERGCKPPPERQTKARKERKGA